MRRPLAPCPVDSTHDQQAGLPFGIAKLTEGAGLSAREQQVLVGAAAGKSTKHIAADLGLSAKTVEYFWARIYSKLRCRSQLQVMALLLRRALAREASPPASPRLRRAPLGNA